MVERPPSRQPRARGLLPALPWETDDLTGLSAGLSAGPGEPNTLVVRVDGRRTWQSLPPGRTTDGKWDERLLGGDAGFYYPQPGMDGCLATVGSTWSAPRPVALFTARARIADTQNNQNNATATSLRRAGADL